MTQCDIGGKAVAERLMDRRAARTRAEIVDTAIRLFSQRGYDETSMEQVADAVGVSRRTIYRYFATKEDIVFEDPRRWLDRLEEVLASRQADESTRELMRRGLVEVAAFVESESERVLAAFSVLGSSPMLAARHGRSDAEWVQRYVAEFMPDVAADVDGPFRALVLSMAVVAGQNAVMIQWAAAHPRQRAVDLMVAMLDQIDSAWPEVCRRPRGGRA